MIYLMRHDADSAERYGGWSAYGLTEEGRFIRQSMICTAGESQKSIPAICREPKKRLKLWRMRCPWILIICQSFVKQITVCWRVCLKRKRRKSIRAYTGIRGMDGKLARGESPEQFFHRI